MPPKPLFFGVKEHDRLDLVKLLFAQECGDE